MAAAVHLTGLHGTNPLGFLAALGTQVAFASEEEQPRLWWTDDVTPHAVVEADFGLERIAEQSMKSFACWAASSAMNPRMPKGDELKFTPRDLRAYLKRASRGPAGGLATALVAEDSLDDNGKAKPSDLYFTAGQQKFLDTARKVLRGVSREDVRTGLAGPWAYGSALPSLGWDVADDRRYALRANDPGGERKRTNPGPEALALLGLTLHPVFRGAGGTLAQGCSGAWKTAVYSWPLWNKPASLNAVKSILAHAYDHPAASDRRTWFRSWGVFRVLKSSIRRSGQGGYGTFRPPAVAWQVGRMESEARTIRGAGRAGGATHRPRNLAEAIRDRFAPLGGVDLDVPPRGAMPSPPGFD